MKLTQYIQINNSTLTHNGQTDDDPDPVFGMTLLYDQTDSNLGNTGYYSGRLSAVKWMSKDGSNTSSKERAFTYNYDAADRYTAANYAERSGSGSFTFTHGWDEAITAYDENGNIKNLTRNATTQGSGSYTPVDNLTYTYQTNNANQLYTVTDATNNQTGFGIQTGGSATGHYQYDVDGNLTSDPYKALTINYDGINKIDKITMTAYTGQYIQYIYDATGNVLEKQQYIGGTLHTATVYINGFVYVNGTLAYFPTPEGRVTYNGTTLTNEYIISDQQGNARISFNNTGTSGAREVIQENSYYGFGMIMPGSVVGPPAIPNKNLYNGGSEWQNDYSNMPDYYQTFNRNYDAAIGRFISADPMAESAAGMSVYQYAGDNPVMLNDPMGNAALPMPGSHTAPSGVWQVASWFGSQTPEDFGWQNQGAFDDPGGFSTDNGEAGAEFWAPANASGGVQPDYSKFWNTALSIASQIGQGLVNSDQNSWSFTGSQFQNLVGLVQNLNDNEQLRLSAYNGGSISWILQTSISFSTDIHGEEVTDLTSSTFNTAIGRFSINFGKTKYSTDDGTLLWGTTISIFFYGNNKMYKSFQWIQTISDMEDGDAYQKLDGENLPFYITTGHEQGYQHYYGVSAYTEDHPASNASIRDFSAESTLIGQGTNGQWSALGTVYWSYWSILNNVSKGIVSFSFQPQFWTQRVINNINSNQISPGN